MTIRNPIVVALLDYQRAIESASSAQTAVLRGRIEDLTTVATREELLQFYRLSAYDIWVNYIRSKDPNLQQSSTTTKEDIMT